MNYGDSKLAIILENKKTVCFGRFLIDVPLSAFVVYGPAEAPVPIVRLPEGPDQFYEVLENKLSEVEGQRELAFGELKNRDSMLGKIIDGQSKDQKLFLEFEKVPAMTTK